MEPQQIMSLTNVSELTFEYIYLPMVWENRIQSQVKSYQRLKKEKKST